MEQGLTVDFFLWYNTKMNEFPEYQFPLDCTPCPRQPIADADHRNWKETRHAVDFNCPPGTPVLAAGDGLVINVKDDAKTVVIPRGANLDIPADIEVIEVNSLEEAGDAVNKVNIISILHADGSISEYGHLAADSAKVRLGQRVSAGQELARTGWSGLMGAPHLHFNVAKFVDKGGNQLNSEAEVVNYAGQNGGNLSERESVPISLEMVIDDVRAKVNGLYEYPNPDSPEDH